VQTFQSLQLANIMQNIEMAKLQPLFL